MLQNNYKLPWINKNRKLHQVSRNYIKNPMEVIQLKNITTEKTPLDEFIIESTEDRISELEDRSIEFTQSEHKENMN